MSLRERILGVVFLFLAFFPFATPATVRYTFDVRWVWANPDGAFPRPVIGVNGHWPPPRIDAAIGDTVVVEVQNSLGNQSTSLHFHGLFMNRTSHMDGTSFVSQCAIRPGSSFRYEFKVSSKY
jgi:iron transport multicopper oxidase